MREDEWAIEVRGKYQEIRLGEGKREPREGKNGEVNKHEGKGNKRKEKRRGQWSR